MGALKKDTVIGVLILDSGAGLLKPVLQALQGVPGLELHVLTRDPYSTARFSRFVRSFSPWSGQGERNGPESVERALDKTRAQTLLPLDEPAMELVSTAGDRLSAMAALPLLPTPRVLELAGDKWLLSRFMDQNKIAQPRTLLLEEAGRNDLAEFPFPALIKRTRGSGGQGIRLFQTRDEFWGFWKSRETGDRDWILQEQLLGGEIDCSLLAEKGRLLAYTIQRPLLPKSGYDFARAIEFVHDQGALDLASRLMAELEYSGIAHVDMIRARPGGRPRILEINPRYWGSLPGSVRAGVNFPLLAVRQALGLPLPDPGFRETRFATAREAARLLWTGLSHPGQARVPLYQTNLINILRDPLPSLAEMGRKLRPGKKP